MSIKVYLAGPEVFLKALSMAGFGRERITRIPVDDQGRIRADSLPPLDDMTLLALRLGA